MKCQICGIADSKPRPDLGPNVAETTGVKFIETKGVRGANALCFQCHWKSELERRIEALEKTQNERESYEAEQRERQ